MKNTLTLIVFFFFSFLELSAQISCPPGQYFDPDIGICVFCPAGTYNPNEGGSGRESCLKCPSGSFQASSGQSSCLPCSPGTSQSLEGQTSCDMCVPGTFSNIFGASTCEDCPAGTFNTEVGQTTCLFCEFGTFQDTPGGTSCITCIACDDGDPETVDYCDATTGNCINLEKGSTVEIISSLRLFPCPGPPENPKEGQIYYDLLLKKVRVFNGLVWLNLN